MTKKALTLALEALEKERPYLGAMPALTSKAITAVKEALSELEQDDEVLGFNGWGFPIEKPSQPEQEPVAFEIWHKANHVQSLEKYGDTYKNSHVRCRHEGWLGAKSILPQRTAAEGEDTHRAWVGLTEEEVEQLADGCCPRIYWQAIEVKLKEKNNGS